MPRSTSTRPTPRAVVPPASSKPRVVRKRSVVQDTVMAVGTDAGDRVTLDPAEIAGRAYELFLAEGGHHGRDVEHWLQAERELKERLLTSAA